MNNIPKIRYPQFKDPWEQRKLGEVFDLGVPNNTYSRAQLSSEGDIKNIHYGDVLTKYPSVLDVQQPEIPYVSVEIDKDLSNGYLYDGDIILADTAEDETAGKVTEVRNIRQDKVVSGLHTIVLRPFEEFAEGYLGNYLNAPAYHKQLMPLLQGIKVYSLSKSNLQKTEISYPGFDEQAQIGRLFQNLDDHITLHRRNFVVH